MLDWFLRFLAALALVLLVACGGSVAEGPDPAGGGGDGGDSGGGGSGNIGGGDGGGPAPVTTALYVASATEQTDYQSTFRPAVIATGQQSVMGGLTMAYADMPVTGSMDYAGYLELLVASGAASANVAGEATLSLFLSDLSITGSAQHFMGSAVDENLEERLVNYAGTILITNGQVTAGASDQALVTLDIDGTLDSGLHLFGVDGTLVGGLYGSGGEGLRARGSNTSLDGSMVTTVDGAPGLVGVGTLSALLTSP